MTSDMAITPAGFYQTRVMQMENRDGWLVNLAICSVYDNRGFIKFYYLLEVFLFPTYCCHSGVYIASLGCDIFQG